MPKTLKIAVIGSGGVGKSCCTLKYLKDKFFEEYDPTVEESYRKQVMVDGQKVNLEVLDTAGQDEFKMFRDMTMGYADGFLIVYAINDRRSWDEAQKLQKNVSRLNEGGDSPAVVIGNKVDLPDKAVPTEEAAEYCGKANMAHYECSAKTGQNVTDVFEALIRLIWEAQSKNNKGKKAGGDCCIVS